MKELFSRAAAQPAALLWIWLGLINLLAFAAMGADKRRARRKRRRIRERTLFLLALPGGAAGAVLGMAVFRHKTQHRAFVLGMPALFLLQVLLAALLWPK